MEQSITPLMLQAIYEHGRPEQAKRYQKALDKFLALYGAGDVYIFRAPGRVNLIGEHTDYNHGFVIPLRG